MSSNPLTPIYFGKHRQPGLSFLEYDLCAVLPHVNTTRHANRCTKEL